jgi:hypothetical protein
LPSALAKKIDSLESNFNTQNVIAILGPILKSNESEYVNSRVLKLYWEPQAFLEEFTASDNQILILSELFDEWQLLFDYSEQLDREHEKQSVEGALEKMQQILKPEDAAWADKAKPLMLELVTMVFGKLFDRKT